MQFNLRHLLLMMLLAGVLFSCVRGMEEICTVAPPRHPFVRLSCTTRLFWCATLAELIGTCIAVPLGVFGPRFGHVSNTLFWTCYAIFVLSLFRAVLWIGTLWLE